MTQYFGDFSEDDTVYIPFNTFDSNDPSASVTITNLADADIKVHKDGSVTQIVTDGATIAIDFDSITGQHLITVDTSAHADYSTGSDYLVRIEGTTVDAGTINAWVGSFSIENRYSAGALRPTTAGRTLDVTATGAAGIDWANVENPTTTLDLSGTDFQLVDTVTTYTGNTVQTGDSFARIGAAGASLTDLGGMSTAMKAEVNAEADTALSDFFTSSAQLVDDMWDEALTKATHDVANSAGKRLRQLSGTIFSDGTAQSGGNNSIQLAAGAVTTDDQFKRNKVIIVDGTGVNQEAIVTSSVASTDTLTTTPAWLTNPDVTSDYVIVPAQAHATVRNGGYDNGMVYVDTVNGAAGTEEGVNGTSTNPSDNLADAYTIAAVENITAFQIEPGSALTLPSDSSKKTFEGSSYTVALNGQEFGDSRIVGCISVTGTGVNTSGGQTPVFERCAVGSVTMPPFACINCGFFGTVTLGSEGNFTFGTGAAIFDLPFVIDFGAALNSSKVFLVDWSIGNVEIQNAGAGTGSYVFEMSGTGSLTVNANCSATTTVTLEGHIARNADVTGVTYVETSNVLDVIGAPVGADISADIAAVKADTGEIGTAGAGLTDLGGMSTAMKAEVNAEADTALTDYDPPTNAEMEARTPTAAQLAYMVENSNTGLPVTFTTSGGSTTVAVLNLVDGGAGSATDDQYNGRLLVFTDGALKGVVTDITDYTGSTTTATITAIPTAPTSSHNARLI